MEGDPFSDREGPLQGQVDVALRRPAQEAGAAVSKVGIRRRPLRSGAIGADGNAEALR